MTKSKLIVGKVAFTTNGSMGTVKSVQGNVVTVETLFCETQFESNQVYHSKKAAWNTHREG